MDFRLIAKSVYRSCENVLFRGFRVAKVGDTWTSFALRRRSTLNNARLVRALDQADGFKRFVASKQPLAFVQAVTIAV
ncbi:hypothetical protein V1478_012017 [Vespula squamosa]|uniref:Uncharacterized protein n=1 Tax=Vespula squamosa TaxID=30214 RepID=A0ABD2AC37_VESSQ